MTFPTHSFSKFNTYVFLPTNNFHVFVSALLAFPKSSIAQLRKSSLGNTFLLFDMCFQWLFCTAKKAYLTARIVVNKVRHPPSQPRPKPWKLKPEIPQGNLSGRRENSNISSIGSEY
jgi:hypothetical protein